MTKQEFEAILQPCGCGGVPRIRYETQLGYETDGDIEYDNAYIECSKCGLRTKGFMSPAFASVAWDRAMGR